MTYCLEGHKVKLFNHLFFMPGNVCVHTIEGVLQLAVREIYMSMTWMFLNRFSCQCNMSAQ